MKMTNLPKWMVSHAKEHNLETSQNTNFQFYGDVHKLHETSCE